MPTLETWSYDPDLAAFVPLFPAQPVDPCQVEVAARFRLTDPLHCRDVMRGLLIAPSRAAALASARRKIAVNTLWFDAVMI